MATKRQKRIDIVRRLLEHYGPFEAMLCTPPIRVRIVGIAEAEELVRIDVIDCWLKFGKPPTARASQLRCCPTLPKRVKPISKASVEMLDKIVANPGVMFDALRGEQSWHVAFCALQSLHLRRLIDPSGWAKRRARWSVTSKGREFLKTEKGKEHV